MVMVKIYLGHICSGAEIYKGNNKLPTTKVNVERTFWLWVETISPFQVKWSVPKMIRYLDVAIMEMGEPPLHSS
jgi:hypothetical protein